MRNDWPNFRAHVRVDEDPMEIRVFLLEDRHDGVVQLYSDGCFYKRGFDMPSLAQDNGATPGLRIDHRFLRVLRDAIDNALGQRTESETEARVLREVLDVERARVDDLVQQLVRAALPPVNQLMATPEEWRPPSHA